MKSRESTAWLTGIFVVCYMLFVVMLGSKMIDTELELFIATLPIVSAFLVFVGLYAKDRLKKQERDY